MTIKNLEKIPGNKEYTISELIPIRFGGIIALLKKRTELYEILLYRAKKLLASMPRGILRYTNKKNEVQFFRRRNKKDINGVYITSKDVKTPQELAQKKYLDSLIKTAENDLKKIQKAIGLIESVETEGAIEGKDLPDILAKIVTPVIVSDEDYAKEWMSQRSPVFDAFGNPDVPTQLGFNVKSKSEGMVIDTAVYYGIPIKYEPELTLPDGSYFRPDFVILDLSDRSEIFIEHFGCIDSDAYRDEMCEKINKYARNGIVLGKNFLATFETGRVKFDRETIAGMLKERLDLSLYENLRIYDAA